MQQPGRISKASGVNEARHRGERSVWVCLYGRGQAKLGDRNRERGGMWAEAGKGREGAGNVFRLGGHPGVITGKNTYLCFVQ